MQPLLYLNKINSVKWDPLSFGSSGGGGGGRFLSNKILGMGKRENIKI